MKYFILTCCLICFFMGLSVSFFTLKRTEIVPVIENPVVEDTNTIIDDDTFTYSLEQFPSLETASPLFFNEIWAYVLDGKENTFNTAFPITDVGYFGATIGTFGQLAGVPDIKKFDKYRGRVHLVIVDTNRSLTHFSLNPEYPVRDTLINQIIEASKSFDGLQIDFEYVHIDDKDNFINFLRDLRRRLPQNKIFSIAVPARTRALQKDVYDYAQIVKIVDRMLIMAYDEHWSGGIPGPVASFAWGRNIAKYCVETIPEEKLIMGIPLYGRAWTNDKSQGAYRMTSGNRIMKERNIANAERKDGIPYLKYEISATITLYYDDIQSIYERSMMYQDLGVRSIGFWRMGLEDSGIWALLKPSKSK
ncbi:MAG: glycosyl hydrolase family 18 protein [Treponemataceae bacterium]